MVEGVAHPEPADGEESVLPEIAIAEKRLFQVSEFQEERLLLKLYRKVGEEFPEDFIGFARGVEIFAGAVCVCLFPKSGKPCVAARDAKQLPDGKLVFPCHQQGRAVAGSLFQYPEQFGRMKDIRSRKNRNIFRAVVCAYSDSHSNAKIKLFFKFTILRFAIIEHIGLDTEAQRHGEINIPYVTP